MTILVTGGAGFIGSHFVRYLRQTYGRNVFIVVLDKLTYAGRKENLAGIPLPGRMVLVRKDITDADAVRAVFRKYRPEAVVHFAAETHVDRSILDSSVFQKTNVEGTVVLLDAALAQWKAKPASFKRFVHVSTDEVYGSIAPRAHSCEADPLLPRSPYAASKAAADMFVLSYGHTHGLPVSVTRCSNNYGPRQFPEKLIPFMIERALKRETLPVYGDGLNVRDWIHVEDHCRAVGLVLRKGRDNEIYNIGARAACTNLLLIRRLLGVIRRVTGDAKIGPSLIRFVKDRPGHDRRYSLDPSLIEKRLGWKPKRDLDQGLEETVRWYIENREWIASIRDSGVDTFLEANYKGR
jgi:dTDP-glucose 4,6-dehydratase